MCFVVELRTEVARRIPQRDHALYLVFKLLTNQQDRKKQNRVSNDQIFYCLIPELSENKPLLP
jgi:hypothetical protein